MNVVKFEFPVSDKQESLFISINTPEKDDRIQIHCENGKIKEYFVESITYNFRKVKNELFGSGENTICVKLVFAEDFGIGMNRI